MVQYITTDSGEMTPWKATLKNNTDYPEGISFFSITELKTFIADYYGGEWGDLYSEWWKVEGDYPDDIFDVLAPPEAEGDDNWHIK